MFNIRYALYLDTSSLCNIGYILGAALYSDTIRCMHMLGKCFLHAHYNLDLNEYRPTSCDP